MSVSQNTIYSVITDALIEADWQAQGEQPVPEDAEFCLRKINDILDGWSADEKFVYAKGFNLYTLVPNLSPHTIGPAPGATFALPSGRPVRIDGCTIVISNSDGTTTDIPVNTTRNADWWNFVRIKSLPSQIPTDLYYEPDVPNGSMFLWPVPNFAYQTRVEWWQTITQFLTVQDKMQLPPMYRKALKLSCAEELGGAKSNDPGLVKRAAMARSAIWSNNAQSPTMCTQVAGIPGGGSSRIPDFNFLDGTPW